ncbi:MAG: glycosyltransferase family 4 protein [Coleofasciculaceae cyanobacterium SM2_1_6]|nr:glycosyltransferase family 4 protein [Coleofasciculaceae cyanobacterium SM2_1_6]
MKIAFLDNIEWDYHVDSVQKIPLGGSQSSLCYLARELADLGHQVYLFNSCSTPRSTLGVEGQPWSKLFAPGFLQELDLDFLIILNYAGWGQKLRQLLPPQTKLLLWTQHALDQGAIEPLRDPQEAQSYNYVIFVSEWQRQTYLESLQIQPQQTQIFRNCIAPPFQNLFPSTAEIKHYKTQPPVLAYTSTPFRGLELLLHIFPALRQALPDLTLKVFSSLQVYQLSDQADPYQWLYDQCRQTPGVEYIGSLPQAQLAQALRSTTLLIYPNHFAETSCISVLEAMASGCLVITSDLGALPETTEGFGRLIPVSDNWLAYQQQFIQGTIDLLQNLNSHQPKYLFHPLRWQVNYVNEYYNWQRRAREWTSWLQTI